MPGKNDVLSDLTIDQLQEMIADRRKSQLSGLTERRATLVAELRAIEVELARVGAEVPSNGVSSTGKRRGRPPGSRNKSNAMSPVATSEGLPVKRGRGRPPGSKNKLTADAGSTGRPGRKPADATGGSMKSAILDLLTAAKGEEVAVADMIAKLKSRSSSKKPGTIVSLALMALKKEGMVESAGRGLYRLK